MFITAWLKKPMSLERRQMLDFGFWMAILALGGTSVLLWSYSRLLILPLLVLFLIILWMLVVNNGIAVREIKEKERKSPVQEP